MKKSLKFLISGIYVIIGLLLSHGIALAQNPTYACDIRNPAFVSGQVYEFDLYITRTGTTPLELANYQAGIQVNPLLINGGTITASVVSGSSGLLAAQQPTHVNYVAATNCIRLAPKAPPRTLYTSTSATNGTIIPGGEGARVCRIRLTNSGIFGNFPLSPVWSFTVNPYSTVVSAFVGPTDYKVNTIITNSADHGRSLAVNVLLEGSYDAIAGEMTTTLHDLIPLNQPFNVAPWNYAGTESVTSIPADMVDWVLVDLRDATGPSLAVPSTSKAVRAFFLRKDGAIVDLDGVSAPEFNFSPSNNLYTVIRHRNHIAIMSSTGLVPAGNSYGYDFSTSLTQAYGGAAGYKLLTGGLVYGMVAGDIITDGFIYGDDFTQWALDGGIQNTYKNSDVNLDGNVYGDDFTMWAINGGIGNLVTGISRPGYQCQVPGIK